MILVKLFISLSSSNPCPNYEHVVHTLFVRNIAIVAYVDDNIISSDNLEEIYKVKGYLSKEFKIKYLGLILGKTYSLDFL